jgi:hypothetical protein
MEGRVGRRTSYSKRQRTRGTFTWSVSIRVCVPVPLGENQGHTMIATEAQVPARLSAHLHQLRIYNYWSLGLVEVF